MKRNRIFLVCGTILGGSMGVVPASAVDIPPDVTDGSPAFRWTEREILDGGCKPNRIAALQVVTATQPVMIDGALRTIADVPLIVDGCNAGVEVQIARVDVDDIRVVEVIKGPVGSLFGKNISGGVVNIVTHKGTGELFSSVAAGFELRALSSIDGGHTYESHVVDATRDYFGYNVALQRDEVMVGGVEANTLTYRIFKAPVTTKLFAESRVVRDPDVTYTISDESVGFPPNRLAANLNLDVAFVSRRTSANSADMFYDCSNGHAQVFDRDIPKVGAAFVGGNAIAVGGRFAYAYGRSGTNSVRMVTTTCDGNYRLRDLGTFAAPAQGETVGIGVSALGWDGDVAHVAWQDRSVLVDLRETRDPPRAGFNADGLKFIPDFPSVRNGPANLVDFVGLGYRPVQMGVVGGSVLATFLVVAPTDVVAVPDIGATGIALLAFALLLTGVHALGGVRRQRGRQSD